MDPFGSHAYVELARVTIKAGYLRSSGAEALFADGTLDAAQYLLDKALDNDRANGGAYVLYGHLATLQGRYDVARDMLTQADTLEVDDPWRNLNWADLLLRLGDAAGAVAQYRSVLVSDTDNVNALKAAHVGLRDYYWMQGDFEKVEETFIAEIDLEPDSAWVHGDYANFLLYFKPGAPDEALGHAQRAIELMPYPMGWSIYVAALCAKHAEVAMRDPEAGTEYLARAQEIEASACSGAPR